MQKQFHCNPCLLRGASGKDSDGRGRGELPFSQTIHSRAKRQSCSCFFKVSCVCQHNVCFSNAIFCPCIHLSFFLSFFILSLSHAVSLIFRGQKSESSSDSSESDSDSDSELIGPPVPPHPAAQEDDEELVGPPLPPGYTGSTAQSDDDDDDEGETQDDDDDVGLK